ncbi:hypothetical protein LCM10_09595 [Rossellomorea aquimaris]|uniref:hypothetical protein n=1 Tax=Rossellomorea aquimaris TaxID=189382 RepID=UPI001CD2BA9A|nr:hypothetical protein [Rossellomorea aquimaris]MCA1055236.1 hypothetical protein [Rossellomorea aquimaris]
MKKVEGLAMLKVKWHSFRVSYHYALLECCLDCKLKQRLHASISYHEKKLAELRDQSRVLSEMN